MGDAGLRRQRRKLDARARRAEIDDAVGIDDAGERIYGTQGDGRCEFDEVEQRKLEDAALPAGSYRISARGFCVAPARALDGDGAVMLTRFDFAGLVSLGAGEAPRQAPPP